MDELKIKELVEDLFDRSKDRGGGACCCCCCCCCCSAKKKDEGNDS